MSAANLAIPPRRSPARPGSNSLATCARQLRFTRRIGPRPNRALPRLSARAIPGWPMSPPTCRSASRWHRQWPARPTNMAISPPTKSIVPRSTGPTAPSPPIAPGGRRGVILPRPKAWCGGCSGCAAICRRWRTATNTCWRPCRRIAKMPPTLPRRSIKICLANPGSTPCCARPPTCRCCLRWQTCARCEKPRRMAPRPRRRR